MTRLYYYLLILILIGAGTVLKFAHSHEAMPIGCDEFGYLDLSNSSGAAIFENTVYPLGLLDTLRGENIPEQEFSWMVTPHAYHVIRGTNQVINQYPPGTSYLLKLIPLECRKLLFPLVVMLLLILLPALLPGNILHSDWNVFDLIFPAMLFIITVSAPFTTELARVNSLAVTFGLLLSAGMILRSKPLLACFLIALSVNFRIVNILMTIPVLLFLPFSTWTDPAGRKANILLLFRYGLLIIAACIPVLLYNYQLLGNPLASTYSVIDTAVNKGGNYLRNLNYYISMDHRWLRVHLVAIVILMLLCISSKLKWLDLIKIAAFPVLNYLFFSWHSVTMDYYPYASALLLWGMALGVFYEIKLPVKYRFMVIGAGILFAVVVLISGFNRYRKKDHLSFSQAKEKYSSLCEYDIVWCDLYSGTTEYVCGNQGFRFATGSPRARGIALQYLHSRNLDQVILLGDVPVPATTVESELQASGLPFEKKRDSELGELIVIPGSGRTNIPR